MDKNAHLGKAVADFYETHGPAFAATRKNYWGVMGLVAERLSKGRHVLDVGAGNARLAMFLPIDARYIAIEPSGSLCAQARKVVAERGEGEVRLGGFPHLPATDGEADVVACLAVLHHIPGASARKAAIEELRRVLRPATSEVPGGTLVLTAWNLRSRRFISLRNWLAAWFRLPLVGGGGLGDVWVPWKAEGASVDRYVHAFTLAELRGLFREGWDVELCVPWGLTAAASTIDAVNLLVIAHKK